MPRQFWWTLLEEQEHLGLTGIKAKRDDVFIKPLIELERDEIEEYCLGHNLNPRRDKTNNENIYTRNKVRNILIPLIKLEFNPNIINSLARLSSLANLDNSYLEEMTNTEFERILIDEGKEELVLDLKEFNKLHEAIKPRIVLLGIKKLNKSTVGISKIHIDDIIKLCENNIGNKHLTPNKNIKIAVNRGKMYFFVNKKT